MTQLNEIKRMQQLAGIITEAEAGVNIINNPIVQKQPSQTPTAKPTTVSNPSDPTKVNWNYAGSEKTDSNKKKYVLRATLNNKPAAYAFLDIATADPKEAVFTDKQIDSLVDSLKRKGIEPTGVDWNTQVKVKLQVIDTETNKVINNYNLTKDGGLKSLGITGGGSYMGAV
jgi:hypothetical protein